MGRVGSADIGFVLAGGYSLRDYITEVDVGPKEAVLERGDTLGDAWEEHDDTHIRRAGLRFTGFYDEIAGGPDAALVALAQQVVMVAVEPNTAGKQFAGYEGAIPAYSRRPARGELTKFEAAYQPTGRVDEGIILHPLAAYSADPFLSTGQDNTALSTNGGAGYVEVVALTLGGFTSVQYKIRHSTDNVTYADLITFTNITAAPSAQRGTAAGTVNRWVRAEGDWQGAGAAQTITLASGFARY